MDVIKQLNNAIAYIEENLCDEIDTNRIAEITLCPYDKFKRFFSYMTDMSVSEYIRKRRLTLAAYDLLKGLERIIDLAVKYGYSSADSFMGASNNSMSCRSAEDLWQNIVKIPQLY